MTLAPKIWILVQIAAVAASASDFQAPITGYAGSRVIVGIPGGAVAQPALSAASVSAIHPLAPHAAIWFDGELHFSRSLDQDRKGTLISGRAFDPSHIVLSDGADSALLFAQETGRMQRVERLNSDQPLLSAAFSAVVEGAISLALAGSDAYFLTREGSVLRLALLDRNALPEVVMTGVGKSTRIHTAAGSNGVTVADTEKRRLWRIDSSGVAMEPWELPADATDSFGADLGSQQGKAWIVLTPDHVEIRSFAEGSLQRELPLAAPASETRRIAERVWLLREGGDMGPVVILDLTAEPNTYFVPVKQ